MKINSVHKVIYLTNKQTNKSMEQSPSWEANSHSPSQEIPCVHGTWRFIAMFTRAHPFWGPVWHFLTSCFIMVRNCYPLTQFPSWWITPCLLYATSCPVYSSPPSISRGRIHSSRLYHAVVMVTHIMWSEGYHLTNIYQNLMLRQHCDQ
jgi:hypothetical protein